MPPIEALAIVITFFIILKFTEQYLPKTLHFIITVGSLIVVITLAQIYFEYRDLPTYFAAVIVCLYIFQMDKELPTSTAEDPTPENPSCSEATS